MTFLEGRDLYEQVIRDGVMRAKRSVWIATANVKELFVEPLGLKRGFRSILEVFDDLAERGVDLRLMHADLPSRRFRAAFDRHKRLVKGGLKMKQCARLHTKAIIVDGEQLYLGSANFTGAGLGAKAEERRNFEFGFWTADFDLLDRTQAMFEDLWTGGPCESCALKEICPDPGAFALKRRRA